jgi:hypothetical protein
MNEETDKILWFDEESYKGNIKKLMANMSDYDKECLIESLKTTIHVTGTPIKYGK